MDLFAPKHLILLLVVVLLVFGTKKLRNIGSDLGSAVRGFKKAMNDGDADEQAAQAAQKQLPPNGQKDADFHEAPGATSTTGKDDRRA
jgi:sec-independent protein translocase protein TatA